MVCATSKVSDQPAQCDQSLCKSLEYSMTVKLLTEHYLEFLIFKGGCTGSSESTRHGSYIKKISLNRVEFHQFIATD